MTFEPDLGERLTLQIDPLWPNKHLWTCPLGDKLHFTFVDLDEGVEEASSPNYDSKHPLGRAEGYRFWTGTGNKTISLRFQFVAQGIEQGTVEETLMREVVLPMRFLDALKYRLRDPASGLSYGPPPCILRFGKLFTARVVLTGGNPRFRVPLDPTTMLPHFGDFSAEFTVVRRRTSDLDYSFKGFWR